MGTLSNMVYYAAFKQERGGSYREKVSVYLKSIRKSISLIFIKNSLNQNVSVLRPLFTQIQGFQFSSILGKSSNNNVTVVTLMLLKAHSFIIHIWKAMDNCCHVVCFIHFYVQESQALISYFDLENGQICILRFSSNFV